jgi:hypothetical protein
MPDRIFFRDELARVTSTELVIGAAVYAMKEIQSARGFRRRRFLNLPPFQQYALVITTAQGEREVFRHRNGYLVFQLAKAIEAALREAGRAPSVVAPPTIPDTAGSNTFTGSLAT